MPKRNFRKPAKKSSKEFARDRKWRQNNLQESESWTQEMADALRSFQKYCTLCLSPYRLEIDHVRPLSRGFALQPGNACILCKKCNTSKSAKDIVELSEQDQTLIMQSAVAFKRHWIALQENQQCD